MTDLGTISQIEPKISKSVMAGDDAYQLVLVHCVGGVASLAAEGLVENWNDIPNVDFTKKWWKSAANENLSVGGIQTHVSSEFIRSDVVALLFNPGMVSDYSLDDPYKLVFDGKWTWDRLGSMSKAVVLDTNGDGIMDDQDQYGFVGARTWEIVSVPYSCGQLMMENDSNAMYEVVNFKQGDFASFYAAEESGAIDYYNGVCEAILEKYGG